MTTRRPQDPMTKKIRDEEDHIATLNPYAKRAGGATDDDPGATTLPEDLEPAATVMPDDLEMPAPKANRAAQPPKPPARAGDKSGVRSPSPTFSGDPATRQAVRDLAAGSIEPPTARSTVAPPKARDAAEAPAAGPRVARNTETVLRPRAAAKRGSSWVVWVLAFLVLAGIGFGVSWFILNPGGGDAADPGSAAAEPSDKPPEAVAAVAAAPTESDASSDTAAAAPPEIEANPAPTPDVIAAGGEATPDAVVAVVADVAVLEAGADATSAVTDATPGSGSDSALAAADAGPSAEPDATAVAMAQPAADVANGDAAMNTGNVADASALPTPTPANPLDPVNPVKVAPKPKNPAEATRLNEAGLKARKAGDHEKALAFYAEALGHNPDNVWARYNYACELALLGRGREALVELTTLYKMDTADARKALAAARKDSDFASIRDSGQFFRLTNF